MGGGATCYATCCILACELLGWGWGCCVCVEAGCVQETGECKEIKATQTERVFIYAEPQGAATGCVEYQNSAAAGSNARAAKLAAARKATPGATTRRSKRGQAVARSVSSGSASSGAETDEGDDGTSTQSMPPQQRAALQAARAAERAARDRAKEERRAARAQRYAALSYST